MGAGARRSRRVLQDDDPPAAAAAAARALEIDPQLAEAHLLARFLSSRRRSPDQAREELDKVLAFNPSSLEAHSILGAMAYVRDDQAGFDAEVAKVLAINPMYGEVYRVAAEQAASHYRFDEAVALAQKALTLDQTDSHASGDLGMHLMRTATSQARAAPSIARFAPIPSIG